MSTISLVADLNEKIICENITDYPTFRRFLLTIRNRDERIGYIRKYLQRFVTDIYLYSFSPVYDNARTNDDVMFTTINANFGITKQRIVVLNDLVEIPFDENIDILTISYGLSTLKNLKAYANIEIMEIRGRIIVSPEDFVRAFPKLRILKCIDENFIDCVLEISTTIEEIEFFSYHGLDKLIPLRHPKIKFTSTYDGVSYLENSEIPTEPVIKNLSCILSDSSNLICEFDPINAKIEALNITVNANSHSPLVIPKCYKDLRFLSILFLYTDYRNVDIVIDGFPLLEFIEIYSADMNRATCRIANVPYIFCLKTANIFDLDIDYKTVSILEYRN
jgi:hypothetical protein